MADRCTADVIRTIAPPFPRMSGLAAMLELDKETRCLTTRERALWLGIRRALLLAVSVIDAYLGKNDKALSHE